MTNKQSITIERDIPDGWKLIDFRVPKKGEYALSPYLGVYLCRVFLDAEGSERPIVERINNEGGE